MIEVLVADDELPARRELATLLAADPRIGRVETAGSGAAALHRLTAGGIRAAFLDIHMPGLDGFDLARVIRSLESPPAIVFVTADEERAVEAFDLDAADYLLKPVRLDRLRRAVDRALAGAADDSVGGDEMLTVTVGTSIRRVRRSEVRYVQAQGDYARLHTDESSVLLRTPLAELEARWADAGFLRVHRSFLVALDSVTAVRFGDSPAVRIGGVELPVSRRLRPSVRDALGAAGRNRTR